MFTEPGFPGALDRLLAGARGFRLRLVAGRIAGPLRRLAAWRQRQKDEALLEHLDPAMLDDAGLRRIGDIVVAAETPDHANNNRPRRAA